MVMTCHVQMNSKFFYCETHGKVNMVIMNLNKHQIKVPICQSENHTQERTLFICFVYKYNIYVLFDTYNDQKYLDERTIDDCIEKHICGCNKFYIRKEVSMGKPF